MKSQLFELWSANIPFVSQVGRLQWLRRIEPCTCFCTLQTVAGVFSTVLAENCIVLTIVELIDLGLVASTVIGIETGRTTP